MVWCVLVCALCIGRAALDRRSTAKAYCVCVSLSVGVDLSLVVSVSAFHWVLACFSRRPTVDAGMFLFWSLFLIVVFDCCF